MTDSDSPPNEKRPLPPHFLKDGVLSPLDATDDSKRSFIEKALQWIGLGGRAGDFSLDVAEPKQDMDNVVGVHVKGGVVAADGQRAKRLTLSLSSTSFKIVTIEEAVENEQSHENDPLTNEIGELYSAFWINQRDKGWTDLSPPSDKGEDEGEDAEEVDDADEEDDSDWVE